MKRYTQSLIIDFINKILLKNPSIKPTSRRTRFSFELGNYFSISAVGHQLISNVELSGGKDPAPLKNLIDQIIKDHLQPFTNHMLQLEYLGSQLVTGDEEFNLERLPNGVHVIVIEGKDYQKLVYQNLEFEFNPVNDVSKEMIREEFIAEIRLFKERHNLE